MFRVRVSLEDKFEHDAHKFEHDALIQKLALIKLITQKI